MEPFIAFRYRESNHLRVLDVCREAFEYRISRGLSEGYFHCVLLMRTILAKPISHPTKVDTVYLYWTLHQSRRWAGEQGPGVSRAARFCLRCI